VHGKESHVCRLKKALYGLKQAPRAWCSRIDTYLQGMGFTKSEVDLNLYFIVIGEEPLTLVLYVDDLVITGAERLIERYKRDLATEFEMKYISLMHYFLALECVPSCCLLLLSAQKSLLLSFSQYAHERIESNVIFSSFSSLNITPSDSWVIQVTFG